MGDVVCNYLDYQTLFAEYYQSQGQFAPCFCQTKTAHYQQRITCYKLHLGLWGLFLEANRNQQQDYQATQRRVKWVIDSLG